jgi:hypothetical protein
MIKKILMMAWNAISLLPNQLGFEFHGDGDTAETRSSEDKLRIAALDQDSKKSFTDDCSLETEENCRRTRKYQKRLAGVSKKLIFYYLRFCVI